MSASAERHEPAVRVSLRVARWRDLGAVYGIHRRCFPNPYPLWRFGYYQLRPRARILVAASEGRTVGYTVGAVSAHLRPPSIVGEIISVAVLRSVRRMGIGSLLLDAVIDYLGSEGMSDIYLQVATSNGEAKRLYERFGFATVERLRRYYVSGEDAFLMVRHRPDS